MGFEIQTDVAPQEQDVKNKFHLSTLEPLAAVIIIKAIRNENMTIYVSSSDVYTKNTRARKGKY